MFKQIYIRRNIKLFNKIQVLLVELEKLYGSDKSVANKITVEDISRRVNSDYKEQLESRKKWKHIFEDEVLLTALKDELKRLKDEYVYNSQCG